MQVAKLKLLFIFLFLTKYSLYCQNDRKKYFLSFEDNKQVCKVDDSEGYKKYTKVSRENISFLIRDCKNDISEHFYVDKKAKIGTLDKSFLTRIAFTSIEDLNKLNMKERKSNNIKNKLKNSSFYIVEIYKGYIVKYKVLWKTRVLNTVTED